MTEQPARVKPIGYPTKEQFEKLEPLLDGRITEQPKSQCKCIDCNLPELESNKPGVPNTELLIVKTVQGLTTCINNELKKLPFDSKTGVIIAKALKDINSFEKNPLFELQKAFE